MRLFILVISLLLASCARHSHGPAENQLPNAQRTIQNRPMPAFNRVEVKGALNVSLHTGYKQPAVLLHGDPRDLVQLNTKVNGDNLLILMGKGYPRYGEVNVEIRSHYLNGFTYKGSGTITGERIHSGLLDLSIDNPGYTTLGGTIFLQKVHVSGGGTVQLSGVTSQYLQPVINDNSTVQLVGMMSLSKLNLEGKGSLSMYWIKSDRLTICGRGQSYIQLAGIVNTLDVELWGTARFNGRYLRARRSYVKTHGRSIADVTTTKYQHTLATDASDIYFYNLPDTKTDFMAYAGSVLDMRDWNLPDLRDYTRYNK